MYGAGYQPAQQPGGYPNQLQNSMNYPNYAPQASTGSFYYDPPQQSMSNPIYTSGAPYTGANYPAMANTGFYPPSTQWLNNPQQFVPVQSQVGYVPDPQMSTLPNKGNGLPFPNIASQGSHSQYLPMPNQGSGPMGPAPRQGTNFNHPPASNQISGQQGVPLQNPLLNDNTARYHLKPNEQDFPGNKWGPTAIPSSTNVSSSSSNSNVGPSSASFPGGTQNKNGDSPPQPGIIRAPPQANGQPSGTKPVASNSTSKPTSINQKNGNKNSKDKINTNVAAVSPVACHAVQEVINEVPDLEKAVAEFTGSKGDKRFKYLEEMLTRLLIRLDRINSEGNEDIRVMRRDAVKLVQCTLDQLELKGI